jgi:sugar phosphate isomerase/epimerase
VDKDKIVLPTCEVSMDPETAIEIGASWGIRHFELKTMWEGKRVPFITDTQKEQIKAAVANYGSDVVAFSPGLFIAAQATEEAAAAEMRDKLPRSIDMACELGSKIMIIFAFLRTEGVPESWVIEKLARTVEVAKGSGLTLAIEPLPKGYCDSGQAMSRIIRAIGSDLLGVNWDAANVEASGFRAYPDEYRLIKDLVAHVHMKNYSSAAKRWAVFDEGDVDLREQLGELKRDGYDGYISIETHTRYNKGEFRPILGASKHNYAVLTRYLAEI